MDRCDNLIPVGGTMHPVKPPDVSVLVPRVRAERVVAGHPKLGTPTGPLTEGPDEIFFQDFGIRSVYHGQRHGTWLLYGEILNASQYRGERRFTLGPPVSTEENAPDIRDEELVGVVTSRWSTLLAPGSLSKNGASRASLLTAPDARR